MKKKVHPKTDIKEDLLMLISNSVFTPGALHDSQFKISPICFTGRLAAASKGAVPLMAT